MTKKISKSKSQVPNGIRLVLGDWFLEFPVQRGFTLIETMVAVTILTLSVAGPLFTANSAIIVAMIARDQLIASYLAQEGIEYVRAMRDNEFLAVSNQSDASSIAWNNFLTNPPPDTSAVTLCRPTLSVPTRACAFDPVGTNGVPSLSQCLVGACPSLYRANNGTSDYYTTDPNASGAVLTPFTRAIQVVDIPGTTDPSSPAAPYPDKRIVSTVTWSYRGTLHTVMITDHLTPWQ